MIEGRICELERELRQKIDGVLQKEDQRRFKGLHYWLRELQGFHEPHANDYVSFVGMIGDEDKRIIDEAKENWKGDNQWIQQQYPNFERWLEQSHISEDFLSELLGSAGQFVDSRGPYRAGSPSILGGCLITPEREDVPRLIARLNYQRENGERGHPVEQATELHYNFVNIHPFYDGNGRVSRLLTNLTLVRNGFPALDISKNNKEEKKLYGDSLLVSQWTRDPKYFAEFMALKMMRTLAKIDYCL